MAVRPEVSFAVVMATYTRSDGSTPDKLRRALLGVAAQEWPLWHVFIVGDAYENMSELQTVVAQCIPASRVTVANLKTPGERGVLTEYLWQNAGATAVNTGMAAAEAAGFVWAAHLDDDDEWTPDHLRCLAAGIDRGPKEAQLVHTQAQYLRLRPFPTLPVNDDVSVGRVAIPCNVVHSSVALRTHLRYKTSGNYAADEMLWRSVPAKATVHVPACTVFHLTEGKLPPACRMPDDHETPWQRTHMRKTMRFDSSNEVVICPNMVRIACGSDDDDDTWVSPREWYDRHEEARYRASADGDDTQEVKSGV